MSFDYSKFEELMINSLKQHSLSTGVSNLVKISQFNGKGFVIMKSEVMDYLYLCNLEKHV